MRKELFVVIIPLLLSRIYAVEKDDDDESCTFRSGVVKNVPNGLFSTVSNISPKGVYIMFSLNHTETSCVIKLNHRNNSQTIKLDENKNENWALKSDAHNRHIARLHYPNSNVSRGYYEIEFGNGIKKGVYVMDKPKNYQDFNYVVVSDWIYSVEMSRDFQTCLDYNRHFPHKNNLVFTCDNKICGEKELRYRLYNSTHYQIHVLNQKLDTISLICYELIRPKNFTKHIRLKIQIDDFSVDPLISPIKSNNGLIYIILSFVTMLIIIVIITVYCSKKWYLKKTTPVAIVYNNENSPNPNIELRQAFLRKPPYRPRLLSLRSTTSTYLSSAVSTVTELNVDFSEFPIIRDRYTPFENVDIGNVLGEGNFGRVQEAHLKDNGACWKVAAKTVKDGDNSDFEQMELLKEAETMLKIGYHPNIVNLQRVTFDAKNNLYLLLEHCENDSLLHYIRNKRTIYKESLAYERYKSFLADDSEECIKNINTMISWAYQVSCYRQKQQALKKHVI